MEKYEKARNAAKEWHRMYDELREETSQKVFELEEQNKQMLKTVHKYKKQLKDIEDAHKEKIFSIEKEKILLEGRIQQLEDGKKELQERYNDLKQDYREQCKYYSSIQTKKE